METNNDGFTKSLNELLQFANNLTAREKELEQQHQLEIGKLKKDHEFQLQIIKGRNELLQEENRRLTEEAERVKQNHSVLVTKHECAAQEAKQFRDQYHEKAQRVEELEKIVRILRNDKTKVDNQLKQLIDEKQLLDEKLQQMLTAQAEQQSTTAPTSATQPVSDDVRELITKAVAENQELRMSMTERDNEIQRLNEQLSKSSSEESQLNRNSNEDPQLIKQHCLELIQNLKKDFRLMYENQSQFFLDKIDLLKREQRDNIAKIYEH